MSEHPDIEKLPLEIDGIPVRETIREIFRNPENGTPDNISKAGCLALALKSNEVGGRDKGYVVWNAWRMVFPARKDFVRFQKGSTELKVSSWVNVADFSSVDFTLNNGLPFVYLRNFSKFKFDDGVDFQNSIWSHDTNLNGAIFGCDANFENSEWQSSIIFQNVQWGNWARFKGSRWGENIQFEQAVFGDVADFSETSWKDANFASTRFGRRVCFSNAKFFQHAYFGSKVNEDGNFFEIDFSKAIFFDQASFLNRKFLGTTKFNNTKFAIAPIFHGCDLHSDTNFDGAEFPLPAGSEDAPRAYRTLKLAFSKQQAIREEQRFFRLEMEEETLRETGLKRLLFQAYKTFSDYGFSITRPLKYGGLAVLVLTALYGLLSWLGQCGLSVQACHFAPQWLEFSLLQTLPLPGLDKLSEAASKAFWPQGAWWSFGLSALVILHKTLSLAVLFFIGLALRNLFKLK
ncbi:pentapeptide repeat-containing protein [Limnohabitans sp. DM1]|uniref:pentapeptide repeat-containing protein n=1 Tax=Limnohabitans sp. DM1 TaxID=1597955 RepID=UPI000A9B67AD|nr:pentapeptide repeat-containing protein [Limnohabitans sp. DM1]